MVVVLRSPDVLHLRRWIAAFLLLLFSPVASGIGERVYRAVARNRYRLGRGMCVGRAA